jgi:hypothetical protein
MHVLRIPIKLQFSSSAVDWGAQFRSIPEVQQAQSTVDPSRRIPLLQRALDICGGAFPPSHPLTVRAKVELALAHAAALEPSKALPLLTAATASCESPPLARALSVNYLLLGDASKAEQVFTTLQQR